MRAEPEPIERLAKFLCERQCRDPWSLRPGNMAFHSSFHRGLFIDGEYDHLFDEDPEFAPDGDNGKDPCMWLWRDSVDDAVAILRFLDMLAEIPTQAVKHENRRL